MSRNILIVPNRGTSGATDLPYIAFSGYTAGTISLKVEDDGSIVYEGDTGALFGIEDNKDGLLHSVNDVSGLPIFQVWDENMVKMGKWDNNTLIVSGNSWNVLVGDNHTIADESSLYSSIIGGSGHTVNTNTVNSVIIGGKDITASADNTVYVPNLNIGTISSGTSVGILKIDASGNVISGATDAGEVNTASNIGSANNIFAQKSASDLEFRTLSAGTNVQIISGATTLTISAATGGGVATDPIWDVEGDLVVATGADSAVRIPIGSAGTFLRSNATTAAWSVVSFPNSATTGDIIYASSTNNYDNISPGTAGHVLTSNGAGSAPSYQASSGEVNTGNNVGGGNEVFKSKTGTTLNFRTITAGPNIAITSGTTTLQISGSTGGSIRVTSSVTTTNATPTELEKIDTLTDNAMHLIEVYVTAISTGATEYGIWKRTLAVQKNGGTVTIHHENADVDHTSNGLSSVSLDFNVNSGDIDVDVTGIAATTINWNSKYEIITNSIE